jgi:hypothetical protein
LNNSALIPQSKQQIMVTNLADPLV